MTQREWLELVARLAAELGIMAGATPHAGAVAEGIVNAARGAVGEMPPGATERAVELLASLRKLTDKESTSADTN